MIRHELTVNGNARDVLAELMPGSPKGANQAVRFYSSGSSQVHVSPPELDTTASLLLRPGTELSSDIAKAVAGVEPDRLDRPQATLTAAQATVVSDALRQTGAEQTLLADGIRPLGHDGYQYAGNITVKAYLNALAAYVDRQRTEGVVDSNNLEGPARKAIAGIPQLLVSGGSHVPRFAMSIDVDTGAYTTTAEFVVSTVDPLPPAALDTSLRLLPDPEVYHVRWGGATSH